MSICPPSLFQSEHTTYTKSALGKRALWNWDTAHVPAADIQQKFSKPACSTPTTMRYNCSGRESRPDLKCLRQASASWYENEWKLMAALRELNQCKVLWYALDYLLANGLQQAEHPFSPLKNRFALWWRSHLNFTPSTFSLLPQAGWDGFYFGLAGWGWSRKSTPRLLRCFARQTDLKKSAFACGRSARNAFIEFAIKAMLAGKSLLWPWQSFILFEALSAASVRTCNTDIWWTVQNISHNANIHAAMHYSQKEKWHTRLSGWKKAQWVTVWLCVCEGLGLLGGFWNRAQGAIWARGGAREWNKMEKCNHASRASPAPRRLPLLLLHEPLVTIQLLLM